MLHTANFIFSLMVFVFMVGTGFARRTESRKSAANVAFILAGFALVICLWTYVNRESLATSSGYLSADASRVVTRLDSLDAHIRGLRLDLDVVQRRIWYLSRGQEQTEILQSVSDSLKANASPQYGRPGDQSFAPRHRRGSRPGTLGGGFFCPCSISQRPLPNPSAEPLRAFSTLPARKGRVLASPPSSTSTSRPHRSSTPNRDPSRPT